MQTKIEDQITLEYHGKPVELGRMNSYEVASYIIAFSDFLGIISHTAYGEKIELKTEIQGFRKDSFDIDFVLQIAGIATTIFSSTSFTPQELIDFIRDSIKAWIHLNGYPPKTVSPVPETQNVMQIENQNGQIAYYNAEVINIISNVKAGKATEQFIRKPLESGLSYLRIKSKKYNEISKIENKDATSFIPINIERPLHESEMRMSLLIESPTFKEGNKWRFFDGQSSFYADIIDEEFINKVNSGVERFGKGDTLTVTIRLSQTGAIGELRMERTIIKVLKT
jgi:hypothetical protein